MTFYTILLNPLSPNNTLEHHFTSQKTDLIVLQLTVLEGKFPRNSFANTWLFFKIFHPLQLTFIHYKSRIATAIHGL